MCKKIINFVWKQSKWKHFKEIIILDIKVIEIKILKKDNIKIS